VSDRRVSFFVFFIEYTSLSDPSIRVLSLERAVPRHGDAARHRWSDLSFLGVQALIKAMRIRWIDELQLTRLRDESSPKYSQASVVSFLKPAAELS